MPLSKKTKKQQEQSGNGDIVECEIQNCEVSECLLDKTAQARAKGSATPRSTMNEANRNGTLNQDQTSLAHSESQ